MDAAPTAIAPAAVSPWSRSRYEIRNANASSSNADNSIASTPKYHTRGSRTIGRNPSRAVCAASRPGGGGNGNVTSHRP